MKRWLIYCISLGLALAGGWLWLENSPQPMPRVDSALFVPNALKLHFAKRIGLVKLVLRDNRGNLLLDQRYNGVERSLLEIPLAWSPNSAYELEVYSPGGRAAKRITSPGPEAASGLWVQLLAPYDGMHKEQTSQAWKRNLTNSAVIPSEGFTTCALVLKNYLAAPVEINGRIELPPGAKLASAGPQAIKPYTSQKLSIALGPKTLGEQEVFCRTFRLDPPPGEAKISAVVQCRAGSRRLTYTRRVDLRPMSNAELASLISVRDPRLPTGKDGFFDRRKQMNTIHYRPAFLTKLNRWLGLSDGRLQYWLPFTYQSLILKNESGHGLGLMVKSRIESLHGNKVPKPFQPPNVFSGSMKDDSVAVSLTLGPKEKTRAVLPVFVTSPPVPGSYRRVITLYSMGSQTPLAKLEYPLYVKSLNLNALGFTTLSGLLSLAAFAVLAVRFRPLLAGLKVRWLVVIALFGSLIFVGVNLPIRVFGSLIYGLLGPFSVVLLGFFNDLLYFTLLVAVVRLIPRTGVVSLITLVRYFLSIMLTGGFNLSDFFYVGSSIAVKEGAFWLAGVTRKGHAFEWSWAGTSLLALLMGLGDAFLNASSLYIHMVLFRLYFADWFIWLNVIVNGLLYTMAGVFLGRSFSRRLSWAEE